MITLDNILCFIVISILLLTIGVPVLRVVLVKGKTKKEQGGQTQQ
jgi:hypothetical protein